METFDYAKHAENIRVRDCLLRDAQHVQTLIVLAETINRGTHQVQAGVAQDHARRSSAELRKYLVDLKAHLENQVFELLDEIREAS